MPSKFKEKFDNVKDAVIEASLVPIGFIINPLVLNTIKKNNLKRVLAENVSIGKNWTEIQIDPAVEGKNPIQDISLFLESCYVSSSASDKALVKMPDGRIIEPEVKIFDEAGNYFQLKAGSFSFPGPIIRPDDESILQPVYINFRVTEKNRRYTKVAIRNKNHRFKCPKVIWKDFKLK